MLQYISICIMAVLAGLSQGVCGFGAGILMMLVLPIFYPVSTAAGISGAMSLALTFMMVVRYRRSICVKKMLLPLLVYALCSATAIHFSSRVDPALLKRIFGGFLICLAIYHFSLAGKQPRAWSFPTALAAWAFSGACSGLFSVGGPLMVLYFLAHTDSKEEFLGTTELLFVLNLAMNAYLRVRNGILTPDLLPAIAAAIIFVSLGLYIANRIVERIDGDRLKNIVYIGVGISGVLNLLH